MTNFQSRWYLFVILFAIFTHDKLRITNIKFDTILKLLKFTSIVLVSFYLYFLCFVIFNSTFNSFENTKKKLYIYILMSKRLRKNSDSHILTNVRANFF